MDNICFLKQTVTKKSETTENPCQNFASGILDGWHACQKAAKQPGGLYTSTPLSYRDYIGSNRGSMYGYEKDVNFPLHSNVSARTKIENLFFTGQSTNMHGILGVTISGVLTCGEILGTEYLMKKVWESN